MSNDSNVSPEEERQIHVPSIGDGTPDTAPWREPTVSWLRRQPVLAALIAANAPLLAAFAGSLTIDNAPAWVPVVLGMAVTVLNIAGALARQAVTPVADPKLGPGVPLVIDGQPSGQ